MRRKTPGRKTLPSPPTPNEGALKHRERRCAVSGENLPDSALMRFVRAPDGAVVPDVANKLPGRGAWVRADRASIAQAAKKGGVFSRAFKDSVTVSPDLAAQVEALLTRRCLDLLGLARRGGGIAFGATQVESAIRSKAVPLLIEAIDGAEEGREKLMSLHIGFWGAPPPAVACFKAAELGVALGRERVIHACLLQERWALAWAAEIGRLAGFRAIVPDSWPASWRSVQWGLGDADTGSQSIQRRGER